MPGMKSLLIKEYNSGKFLARYTGAGEGKIHGI